MPRSDNRGPIGESIADVQGRPDNDEPRDQPVSYRVPASTKAEIERLASELDWPQVDIVLAGIEALGNRKRFLMDPEARAALRETVSQIRGVAANLNTLVRDFHTARAGWGGRASPGIDPASLEADMAAMARSLESEIVEPLSRLLRLKIKPLRLVAPTLATQPTEPDATQGGRLRDRAARRLGAAPAGGKT